MLMSSRGQVSARKVVLATGGWSYPGTGSDGRSWKWLAGLGHTIVPPRPALAPLVIPNDHPLCELAGITAEVHLVIGKSTTSRKVASGVLLCTHFGVSGPAVLDISRHIIFSDQQDPPAILTVNWCPTNSPEELDRRLQNGGKTAPPRCLSDLLPDRLIRHLCELASVSPREPCHKLLRKQRSSLVNALTKYELPVLAPRGWNTAEATAGGVPLSELHLDRMESRKIPGLFIAGEICDVDGRLGGFNLQWAWSSGFLAGSSAARAISSKELS